MVRAANTGISAVIDARGRVLASLGLEQTGVLDVRLPPALPRTLYARFGDWALLPLVFTCWLLVVGLPAIAVRMKILSAARKGD